MNLLWCDDVDRPEGAVSYSQEALFVRNRMPFVIGNSKAIYEGPGFNSHGIYMELYSKHDMGALDAQGWANDRIGGTVGVISGFGAVKGLEIATVSRARSLPAGAEDANILFVNGPNLNMLGTRQTDIYGTQTLKDIFDGIQQRNPKLGISAMQSNTEGDVINAIHSARDKFDAIIINAGGLTHTSVALHDALKCFEDIIIELHISNPHQRESFRHRSFVAPASHGLIAGFGPKGYDLAIMGVMSKL